MRSRPTRYWFSISSPTDRDAAVAEVVDVVDFALAVRRSTSGLIQRRCLRCEACAPCLRQSRSKAHVHLDAANGGQVITFGIEEQDRQTEHRPSSGRRLTRAHDAIDVQEGCFAAHVLVDASVLRMYGPTLRCRCRASGSSRSLSQELVDVFFGQLVAGLDLDLTGLLVDHVIGAQSDRRSRSNGPADW